MDRQAAGRARIGRAFIDSHGHPPLVRHSGERPAPLAPIMRTMARINIAGRDPRRMRGRRPESHA